jgi:hypothetical protein
VTSVTQVQVLGINLFKCTVNDACSYKLIMSVCRYQDFECLALKDREQI